MNGKQKKNSPSYFTERVPTVPVEATVGDVERLLLDSAKNFDSIHYVYVLDTAKKLQGVLSIKDVFREPKPMPVERFMQKQIISARFGMKPSRIGYLALRHNIKAVPLVDRDGIFKGVMPADIILRTIYHSLSSDMFRFAGAPGAHRHATSYDDILHLSLPRTLLHRLPWLLIGLAGGLGIAKIVGAYETLLSEQLILAAFIPLIVYMAAATAAQTNAFIIRDLAVGANIRFGAYFFRELRNDVVIAAITGTMLFCIIGFFKDSWMLAGAVGTALFIAVVSSIFTGFLVPYILSKFRLDPANGTGPLATILQDGLSVAIYFSIASLFF